jgi:hypothetical protein
MNRYIALSLAMLAGAALGAAAVNGLHAQGKGPGAYAVFDISEINNPAHAGCPSLTLSRPARTTS